MFETAGSAYTIAQTPHVVKTGGTIVLVGLHIQDAFQEAVNNKTDLVKAVIKIK